MTDIAPALRNARKNLGLVELIIRESLSGLQCIAKYEGALDGPWGVGCDEDPIVAIEKALAAGAREIARVRTQLIAPAKQESDFEDLF